MPPVSFRLMRSVGPSGFAYTLSANADEIESDGSPDCYGHARPTDPAGWLALYGRFSGVWDSTPSSHPSTPRTQLRGPS